MSHRIAPDDPMETQLQARPYEGKRQNDDTMEVTPGEEEVARRPPLLQVHRASVPSIPQHSSWSVAAFNKAKIRAFFHTYHFIHLAGAEGNLYTAAVYLIVDNQGLIDRISPHRIRLGQNMQRMSVRCVLLGPRRMFTDTYAPRHFWFEMEQPARAVWSAAQINALQLTQRLLNEKATWMHEGFERSHGHKEHTAPAPPPYIFAAPVGFGPSSPRSPTAPTHEKHMIYQPQSPVAEPADAVIERIAMNNLKRLGDANIPQTSATLFVDHTGTVRTILYARPGPDELNFVTDDEEHLTVLRVVMADGSVHLEAPFEPLNRQQRAVARLMQHVLQEACRSHTRVAV